MSEPMTTQAAGYRLGPCRTHMYWIPGLALTWQWKPLVYGGSFIATLWTVPGIQVWVAYRGQGHVSADYLYRWHHDGRIRRVYFGVRA